MLINIYIFLLGETIHENYFFNKLNHLNGEFSYIIMTMIFDLNYMFETNFSYDQYNYELYKCDFLLIFCRSCNFSHCNNIII